MRAASLVLLILLCQGVGLAGARWSAPAIPGWYAGLRKPSFSPPGWIFGPVWTTLYLLMAVAAWRVVQAPSSPLRTSGLTAFFLQLGLNLLWSYLFFRRHAIAAALADVAALWVALAATTMLFGRMDAPAGWLLAPYLAWTTFAAFLNRAFLRLNP